MSSDEISVLSSSISTSDSSFFYNNKDQPSDYSCDFKLLQLSDTSFNRTIHFATSSASEKQSWCSDISQVIGMIFFSFRLFYFIF